MIRKLARLSENTLKKEIEKIPTRNGYGEGLVVAGEKDGCRTSSCDDSIGDG